MYIIAHRFCKGFNKASTTRATRFIKHYRIYGLIFDIKAFHILSANINNKIYLRIKIFSSLKMCHCFHKPRIKIKCSLYKLLAIACNRTSFNVYFITKMLVNIGKLRANDSNRIALIRVIVLIYDCIITIKHNEFCCCASAIYANIDINFLVIICCIGFVNINLLYIRTFVSRNKCIIVSL